MFHLILNVADVSSNQMSIRMHQSWDVRYADESPTEYADLKNRIETQVSKQAVIQIS